MVELNLNLDKKESQEFNELMKHYNVKNRADLISKGIAILKVAAYINKTNGELIARKGTRETKILIT